MKNMMNNKNSIVSRNAIKNVQLKRPMTLTKEMKRANLIIDRPFQTNRPTNAINATTRPLTFNQVT